MTVYIETAALCWRKGEKIHTAVTHLDPDIKRPQRALGQVSGAGDLGFVLLRLSEILRKHLCSLGLFALEKCSLFQKVQPCTESAWAAAPPWEQVGPAFCLLVSVCALKVQSHDNP